MIPVSYTHLDVYKRQEQDDHESERVPWDAAEVACQSAEFSACVIRLYNTAANGGEQIAEDLSLIHI